MKEGNYPYNDEKEFETEKEWTLQREDGDAGGRAEDTRS